MTSKAHLLRPGSDDRELAARCGASLPADASVHDEPPGQRCRPCEVIFRADLMHHPVGGPASVRWALSVQDWRSHAVDVCADHPTGMYRAECGHLLQSVATLYERPLGAQCPVCATLRLEVVQAALDRAAAALRERPHHE